MQGGVGVGAPDGFMEGRKYVEMGVALPVVAHGAALGYGPGVGEREKNLAAFAPGRSIQKLHGVDGLPHVAAGRCRDEGNDAFLRPYDGPVPPLQPADGPPDGALHLRRGDRFKFKRRWNG